jgi:hypothetical protein
MIRVAVEHGRADFTLPAAARDHTTLVVVSALSRAPGPFPVHLRASIGSGSGPVSISSTGPTAALLPSLSGIEEAASSPGSAAPPPVRTFSLMVREGDPSSPRNYLPVRARLRAVGAYVQVYVDERDNEAVPDDLTSDVVATFDRTIHPAASRVLGPVRDIDGDGRLTVLITGWLARMGEGRLAVDGFFRGADLDAAVEPPFGNRCDMVYLSAELTAGPRLRTVLAHEYAHALTFSRKSAAAEGRIVEEEGWLDEGISHLAEDWFTFSRSNLDGRVEAFLEAPERFGLVVPDYYAANLFRSEGHRGCTYSFLRWCGQRHGIEPLLARLIRSPLVGVANLESATGETFQDLYREWSVALFLDGLDWRDGDPPAGPRPAWVTAGGPEECWQAAGTSCHHILIGGVESGPTRVEVAAPEEANLQVTAVPLGTALPRLEMRVSPAPDDDGVPLVRLSVRQRSGESIRFEELSWRQENVRGPASARGQLRGRELARDLGREGIEAGGHLIATPSSMPPIAPEDGPVHFQLIGRDEAGRRVIVRAELSDSPSVRPRTRRLRRRDPAPLTPF